MYRYFIFFTLSLISTTSLLKAGKFSIDAPEDQLKQKLSSLQNKLKYASKNEKKYLGEKSEALANYIKNKNLPETTLDEQAFKMAMIESSRTAYFEANDKKPRKSPDQNNYNLDNSLYADFLNYEHHLLKDQNLPNIQYPVDSFISYKPKSLYDKEEEQKETIKPENKAKIVPQTIEITTDILEELMGEPTIQGWEYVNGEAFGGALIGIKDYRQRSISHTEPEILSDTNGDEDSQILLKRRPDLIDHFYVRYSMEGIKIPFYLFYIENL